MANKIIATVTNHIRVDQAFIDAAVLSGDVLQVVVENQYQDAPARLVNYEDIPVPYKKCLKDAIDYSTYLDEDPAQVYTVDYDGTTHTMSGYSRTGIPSIGDAVLSTDELIAVFMIGWLTATDGMLQLPLTLKPGVALDATEVSDLADKGITVSGTGDSFTTSTDTPFLLQCVKPPLETRKYIVTHNYDINTIRS